MPLDLLDLRRVWKFEVLGAKALIEELLIVDEHLLRILLFLMRFNQLILILSVLELFHNFLIEFNLSPKFGALHTI